MITRGTLTEFRENLSSCFKIRDIHDFFLNQGFRRNPAHRPTDVRGKQRRELVEQYYVGINLKSENDVSRLLAVFADILRRNECDNRRGLVEALKRDSYRWHRDKIVPANPIHYTEHIVAVASRLEIDSLLVQRDRLMNTIDDDPALAVGTAKEMVETVCKTILEIKDENVPNKFPQLVRATAKTLSLHPDNISDNAKGASVIKRLLNNLAQVADGLAELRNLYGTGHGKSGKVRGGVTVRHAHLAVGSAVTLVEFLLRTYDEQNSGIPVANDRSRTDSAR